MLEITSQLNCNCKTFFETYAEKLEGGHFLFIPNMLMVSIVLKYPVRRIRDSNQGDVLALLHRSNERGNISETLDGTLIRYMFKLLCF